MHSSSFSCLVVSSYQHWNAFCTVFNPAIEPSHWALNRRWPKHSAISPAPFSSGPSSIEPVKHGYAKPVDWNIIASTTITSAWPSLWPCWVVDSEVYPRCSVPCHGTLTFVHRTPTRRRRNSLNIRRCRSDCRWIPLTVDTDGNKKSLFNSLALVICTSIHFRLWTLQCLSLIFIDQHIVAVCLCVCMWPGEFSMFRDTIRNEI